VALRESAGGEVTIGTSRIRPITPLKPLIPPSFDDVLSGHLRRWVPTAKEEGDGWILCDAKGNEIDLSRIDVLMLIADAVNRYTPER